MSLREWSQIFLSSSDPHACTHPRRSEAGFGTFAKSVVTLFGIVTTLQVPQSVWLRRDVFLVGRPDSDRKQTAATIKNLVSALTRNEQQYWRQCWCSFLSKSRCCSAT